MIRKHILNLLLAAWCFTLLPAYGHSPSATSGIAFALRSAGLTVESPFGSAAGFIAGPLAVDAEGQEPGPGAQEMEEPAWHGWNAPEPEAGPEPEPVLLAPLAVEAERLHRLAYRLWRMYPSAPLQVGFMRPVEPLELHWQQEPAGRYFSSVRLVSPEARALRMVLEIGRLDAAAGLSFHGEDAGQAVTVSGEAVIEALSFGAVGDVAHRSPDSGMPAGDLYVSPLVEGEDITLQIRLPAGAAPEDVRIRIPAISHVYAPLSALDDLRPQALADDELGCMVNAACEPSLSEVSKGVAAMLFGRGGSTYACSGTLLNDLQDSLTPNFITARHCIASQSEAATLQTYWFYRTDGCQDVQPGPGTISLHSGARLLFEDGHTDMALLRLNGTPPAGAIYQGWVAMRAPLGSAVDILHHPRFSPQKVTQGRIRADILCEEIQGKTFVCRNSTPAAASHYGIGNSSGAVTSGSSGAGLFITGTGGYHYLAGVLSGGEGGCENPASIDVYGRFDLAFDAGLGEWLQGPLPVLQGAQPVPVFRLHHPGGRQLLAADITERDNLMKKYPSLVDEGIAFYASAGAADDLLPIYRYLHRGSGTHLLTADAGFLHARVARQPGYLPEGVAWYAADRPLWGTRPLYRFFNARSGRYFYTVSDEEKNDLIAHDRQSVYQGIVAHVWISPP